MGFGIKDGSVGLRYHFYLNVSVCIALFILKIYLRVPFSWRDLEALDKTEKWVQMTHVQVHSRNNKSLGIKMSVCCR